MFRTSSIFLLLFVLISSVSAREVDQYPYRVQLPAISARSTDLPAEPPVADSVIYFDQFEAQPHNWTFYDQHIPPPDWQVDDWEAFEGNNSWRCFSPDVGSPDYGGYYNDWLVFLLTTPFTIPALADQATFSFHFRAYLEDGEWDGANAWIAYGDNPQDLTLEVLTPVSPAYTADDVVAFDRVFGPGIYPAWVGEGNYPYCETWTLATFDLAAYAGFNYVQVGIGFGSDEVYCSLDNQLMFGYQVDNLNVEIDGQTVWYDDADGGNIGGDPVLLTPGNILPQPPVTWDVFDDEQNAYSPTHYLGINTFYVQDQIQYAESPPFNLPEIGENEEIWMDVMVNLNYEYGGNFPNEYYWRPEVWNPTLGAWGPVTNEGYVYVDGNGGIWEPFSSLGYDEWYLTDFAGMDGVKIRFMFHSPQNPGLYEHARFDDLIIQTYQVTNDVSTQLTIPYPTSVGIPIYGKVRLENLGQSQANDFWAYWVMDEVQNPLYPEGPYSISGGDLLDLWLDRPDDGYFGYLIPDEADIGDQEIEAYHTFGQDEVPDNDVSTVDIQIRPSGSLEMGVDSRDYYGSLSVTAPNDGPVVHLVPEVINPDAFGGITFDIDALVMYSYFHSAAGGCPLDATMTFHVFDGGDTPGAELFSDDYQFTVPAGYTGAYQVEMDVSDQAGLQGLTGDIWLWAEMTTEGMNGYYQPFPYRTTQNEFQAYQFFDFEDAMSGESIEDFGHHITAVKRTLTS